MGDLNRAEAHLLPDGRRLHLHDGPIDLIVEAVGAVGSVETAYRAAVSRFRFVLDELCAELPKLRAPALGRPRAFMSSVARRMERAVLAHAADSFITPMAAVAGSVADEMLAAVRAAADEGLARLSVNNGGDIALWLAPGETTTIGLVDRPDRPFLIARARIAAGDGIGGIATSGAPGRSFSLGIADAVTILARTAAEADAAATVVANAVDLPGDPRIERRPARSLQPDSDLGDRLVTCSVGALDAVSISAALESGLSAAARLVRRGSIAAAALHLQGETRNCGAAALRAVTTRDPAGTPRELMNA